MAQSDTPQEIAERQVLIGDCGDLPAMRKLANFMLKAELFDPADASISDIATLYEAIGRGLVGETTQDTFRE